MQEIAEALTAKQVQVKKIQREIDALQRAAGILAGKKVRAKTKAKAKAKTKTKKTTTKSKSKATKSKRTRPTMSAAEKRAVSKRMKAYWANRRKAKR
jgi:hypothetical protein